MRVIKWGKGSLFVYVFKKYRFLLKNTGLWASKYRFVFPEVGMSEWYEYAQWRTLSYWQWLSFLHITGIGADVLDLAGDTMFTFDKSMLNEEPAHFEMSPEEQKWQR